MESAAVGHCSGDSSAQIQTDLRTSVCCRFVRVLTLTCGQGEELSPDSQHSTQQALVRRKPKDVSVYDLPAVVPLVQIITAALFFHVVPADQGVDI